MNGVFRFLIIIVLLFSMLISPIIQIGQSETPPNSLVYNPEQNFVITFVNYNESLVDVSTIENGLPTKAGNIISYQINYEFNFANQSYTDQINSFVNQPSISKRDWTSSLNITALKEQKMNFERKSIFEKQNGTGIDAEQLENYMKVNPVATTLPNENRFYIYVFNFSRMDDIENDHWFNVTEVDPDSERARFFWRLEWDYDLGNNFEVKFPFAAYTQATEVSLLDPTAFQWYLKWRNLWNVNTDNHTSYDRDLDTLLEGLDPESQKINTTDTIREWLNDWILKIYNPLFTPKPLGTSVSVQLQVMYRGSETTSDNLDWIINEPFIESSVGNILYSQNIDVTANFVDMEVDLFMADIFSTNQDKLSLSPFEDWELYDGNQIFWTLVGNNSLNTNYFDSQAAEIVINGLIYLVDNASYIGPTTWVGGLLTGLGHPFYQKLTILYELDRAFMADHTTKKSGLSRVLVHEIGHSIGIQHTFHNQGKSNFDTFTSDFALDVMGYYPGVSNYSEILTKLYWRAAVDTIISNELISLYFDLKSDKSDSTLNLVSDLFDKIVDLHKNRKYLDAFNSINQALNILKNNDISKSNSSDLNTSLTSIDTEITDSTIIDSEKTATELNRNSTTSDTSSTYSFQFYLTSVFIVIKSIIAKSGRSNKVQTNKKYI